MRKHNSIIVNSQLFLPCLIIFSVISIASLNAQTIEGTAPNNNASSTNRYSSRSTSSYNNSTNSGKSSSSINSYGASSSSRTSSRSTSSRYGRDDSNTTRRPDYATTREQSRNRNKADSGTSNPPSKSLEQGDVRGAAKSTVVKRKTEPSKAAAGGPPSVALAPIKIPQNFKENALYFNPAFAQVQPGDLFDTRLFFYNANQRPAKDMDLWIKYDPAVLNPEWIEMKPMEKKLGKPLQVQVWREDGYIQLQGSLASPMMENVNPLPIIHWRAIGAVGSASIVFQGPDNLWPAIYDEAQNLLRPINLGQRPLAQFNIGIVPPEAKKPGLRDIEEVRATLVQPVTTGPDRVRLVVNASDQSVGFGETGLADLVLINPKGLGIDTVRFRLLYDPTLIQILDADEDNYITQGINLFDGDFHKQMPFGQHLLNKVDPVRGVIDYYVGSGSTPRAYPSGPIARIVYKVLKPETPASFRFEIIDPATRERVTDVGALGRSLLGRSDEVARDALHGAWLPIAGHS